VNSTVNFENNGAVLAPGTLFRFFSGRVEVVVTTQNSPAGAGLFFIKKRR
jgi:hypothetical protein